MNTPDRQFMKGRVALITGGSRGIGRETAVVLARQGANVCVIDVLETETTVKLVKESGQEALGLKTDITKSQEVANAVKRALEYFGKIDILCNIAGIATPPNQTYDILEKDWDLTLNINLKGTFLCTKFVLPSMIKQKYGRIICVSSVSGGWFGWPGWSHYTASKAGVVGFIKTLAQEVGQHGITVNAVAPGVIESDMSRACVGIEGLKKTAEGIPLGRVGQPIDVANVIRFFASEESGYVTGQYLLIDGGLSLGSWSKE